MTALPLRDFTDAEKARPDAIEAAPAAEESARERVARAMWETCGLPSWWWDKSDAPIDFVGYRRSADAAIAVLRGPSSDAEQAVTRAVLDLAEEWERNASVRDFGLSYLVAADRLRSVVGAALDGAR